MLDDATAAFLAGRVIAMAASRNAANEPSLARLAAFSLSPDRRRLRFLLPTPASAGLLADIVAGGPVAAVFSLPSTFQSVQLKGARAREISLEPGDPALVAETSRRLAEELLGVGDPPQFVNALLDVDLSRLSACEFVIEEVYSQTPGPGAGARVAG